MALSFMHLLFLNSDKTLLILLSEYFLKYQINSYEQFNLNAVENDLFC